ncbi:MAG TPA: ABC transporter ATP-binding protein [Xanthobacteraceae bacterium]|jgi:branched-chain amino acid transport system ATP-binding protein
MLRLEHISVAYGKHEALHDVSLEAEAGRTTVILGANGAGKTTLLKTIAGLVRPQPGGRIMFNGQSIENVPPHRIVASGIALVPEGRRLFGEMTVVENLRLGAYTEHARADEAAQLERMLDLFPRLAERRSQLAKTMSGGEQQMLAIARALMSEPKILLLDEPSLGLSPRLVKDLFSVLRTITRGGQAVVLVEQNVHQSLRLADQVHVLENGRIVKSGSPAEIEEDKVIQQAYLGLESERPMAIQVETPVSAGGFYNPAARSVGAQPATATGKTAAAAVAKKSEAPMERRVDSINGSGGGFYNPFARSISPAKSAPAAQETRQAAARHPESAKDSGGFVNPTVRPTGQS